MKFAIIVFPGSNCDMDMVYVLESIMGQEVVKLWHKDTDLQEVDFIQLYDTIFTSLKLTGTTIKINNRKILSGIAEVIGAQDKLIDFTVALDKLDKIGATGVQEEMLEKGISPEAIDKVTPLFKLSGSNTDQLAILETLLSASEEGTKELKSCVL